MSSSSLCSASCYSTSAQLESGCTTLDYACRCSPPATDKALQCVQAACNGPNVQLWVSFARSACAYVNQPLRFSSDPGGGGGSSGSTAVASASGFATSVVGPSAAASGPFNLIASASASVAPAGGAQGGGAQGVGTVTLAPSPDAGAASSSPSLSPGAIAGIAVGGLLGLAAIIGLAVFLVLYRRRTKAAEANAAAAAMTAAAPPIGGGKLEGGMSPAPSSVLAVGATSPWTKTSTQVSPEEAASAANATVSYTEVQGDTPPPHEQPSGTHHGNETSL